MQPQHIGMDPLDDADGEGMPDAFVRQLEELRAVWRFMRLFAMP